MSEELYAGQHEFQGIIYEGLVKEDTLVRIHDSLEYDDSDIVVATFPKSGTTWMQEIVWRLVNGSLSQRSESMEICFPSAEYHYDLQTSGLDLVDRLPSPRLIKTHLDAGFFRRQLEGATRCPRLVVVVREPKDVMTSLYHFHCSWAEPNTYHGDWHHFYDLYRARNVIYSGDYYDHVLSWWHWRGHPKVKVVRYEDMKRDPLAVVTDVAAFLGLSCDHKDLQDTVKETDFAAMKARPLQLYYRPEAFRQDKEVFRKGKVGSWRELFSDEQRRYFDDLTKTRLEPEGLTFN